MRKEQSAFSTEKMAKGWQHSFLRAVEILKLRGPSQMQFWFIALVIGIGAGVAAVLFRLGIENLQAWLYGTEETDTLASFAAGLAWYQVLLIPVIGGLCVGIILDRFTPDGRVRSWLM